MAEEQPRRASDRQEGRRKRRDLGPGVGVIRRMD